MSSRLKIGTVLKEQYEIAQVFGSGKDRAAYLVIDLLSLERVIVWESVEVFSLKTKPPGIREYFQEKGKHYLALNLEGQTLAFMVTIAGQLDDTSAALWMYQICQSVGYWNNLEGSTPLVCLSQSSLSLSAFMLSSADKVMIPAFGVFGEDVEPVLPADAYRFAAPETGEEELAPYSDVYALGGMLYCLLTGQPPPDPEARRARKAKLKSVRKLNRSVSRKLKDITHKALQLNPKKRYPTAAEMAADLAKLVDPSMKSEPKRKKLGVMKYVPLLVTISFFVCLFATYLVASENMPHIKLPRFRKGSVPLVDNLKISFPDLPFGTDPATATPSPFSISEVVVNQVIADRPPRVVAYASVLDDAQDPILGIPEGQFRAKQDDVNVPNITVQAVNKVQDPLTLVVVMDVSGSMLGEPLDKAKAAAATFVGQFGEADRFSLVKFDHEIELVHDFTTDKDAIIGAINGLSPRGDTALYDVIADSVTQLKDVQGRRAIILLSDGRDTASTRNTADSAIAMAGTDSIPVYILGLDSEQFTPEIMEQISTRTGGDYLFAASPDDVQTMYRKVRGQLQNQYRLEFASLHGADGKLHILDIGVVHGLRQETWGDKRYRAP